MIQVFDARQQIIKVRGLTWLALACAVAGVWYGNILYHTFGLHPADGGVLAPLGVRLAWALSVGGLGLLFAAGMLFYDWLYIARVWFDPLSDTVQFSTLHLFGLYTFQVPVQDVEARGYHAGQMQTEGLTVNAPWFAVHIRGRRFFLILDLQGKILEPSAAARIFKKKIERRSH